MLSRSAGAKTYFITVAFVNTVTGEQILFTREMPFRERNFMQQCLFKKAGSYYFGIFLGEKAVMSPKIYHVVDGDKMPQRNLLGALPSRPENLTLHVSGNELYI